MDDARLTYNTVVSKIDSTSEKADKYKLRNDFVIEKNNTNVIENYPKLALTMKRTPKDVRAKACFEAAVAHNLSLLKKTKPNPRYKLYEKVLKEEKVRLKNKKISPENRAALESSVESLEYQLKHIPKWIEKTSKLKKRRRKDAFDHIFIPKSACKVVDNHFLKIYPKAAPELEFLKIKESVKDIVSDFQIRWNRRVDSWYVVFSEEIINNKPLSRNFRTVVIDPGVRTFLTCLDPQENEVFEIGKTRTWYNRVISPRLRKLDKFVSKDLLKGLKRGKERVRLLKAKRDSALRRNKLNHLIDHFHKQTARKLLDRYDVIVLPKLHSKTILKSGLGGLGTDANRKISLLSHCKFHDYLTWKAKIEGKIVVNQNEAYTSKTCFQCGKLNEKLGASKIFKCSHCDGNRCDRDIQACFNIMTRYMSSYSSLSL